MLNSFSCQKNVNKARGLYRIGYVKQKNKDKEINTEVATKTAITLKFIWKKSAKQEGKIKIWLTNFFDLAFITKSSSLAKCYLLHFVSKNKKRALISHRYPKWAIAVWGALFWIVALYSCMLSVGPTLNALVCIANCPTPNQNALLHRCVPYSQYPTLYV